MKETTVKKILDPVIKTDYDWEGIIGSPVSSEYRNKMEYSFGDVKLWIMITEKY